MFRCSFCLFLISLLLYQKGSNFKFTLGFLSNKQFAMTDPVLYQKGCNSKFTSGSELGGVDNFLVGSGDVGTFFLGTSCAGAGGAGEASGAGDENLSSSPSLSGGVGDFCLGTSCITGGSCATGGAWEVSVTGEENFSSSPSLRSSPTSS